MSQSRESGAGATAEGTQKYRGSCHCGAVRFEVEADLAAGASKCNCSVCTKISQLGAIFKPGAFTLLAGESDLGEYQWGAKISRRFFCKHCGVHCFARGHLEQVGGDYVSINYNCLDGVELVDLKVTYWDGRHDNWAAGKRDTPWPIEPVPKAV
jgi:hypothetical protein